MQSRGIVARVSESMLVSNSSKRLIEMEQHEKVLDYPAPFVGVIELGDSSVNLAVRPYAKPQDYWTVYFDLYEQGKNALDTAGIEIPFPQRVVHQA